MPEGASVGNIYSIYKIDMSGYQAAMAAADQRVTEHARRAADAAARVESRWAAAAKSFRAPANSLDALNSRLDALNKRLARTAADSNAFKQLADRASQVKARIDAINVSAGRAAPSGGGLSTLSSIFPSLASGGALVAAGVGAAATAAAAATVKIFQLGGQLQMTRIAFTTMMGSAEKANETINRLVEDSNKSPFTADQYLKAGQSLIAFGESADRLPEILRRVGDLAAGVGKDFNELAILYGKARVAGRLMGEDINELTNAGIPIIGQLAKQFGVTEGAVKKLVESGAVQFAHLEEAFRSLTAEGSKFGGLMAKQSQTLPGLMSTLVGNLQNAAAKLGEFLAPVLTPALELFGKLITEGQNFVDWLRADASEGFASFALDVAKVAVVLNPLVFPFWVLAKAIDAAKAAAKAFTDNVSPWLSLLGDTIDQLMSKFSGVTSVFTDLGRKFKSAFGGLGDLFANIRFNAGDAILAGILAPIKLAIRAVNALIVAVEEVPRVLGFLQDSAAAAYDMVRKFGKIKLVIDTSGIRLDPKTVEEYEKAKEEFKRTVEDVSVAAQVSGKRVKDAFNIEFEIKKANKELEKTKQALDKTKITPMETKAPKVEFIGFATRWQREFDRVAESGARTYYKLEQDAIKTKDRLLEANREVARAEESGDMVRVEKAKKAANEAAEAHEKATKRVKDAFDALASDQKWAIRVKQMSADAQDFAKLWENSIGQIGKVIQNAANMEIAAMEQVQERRQWMMEFFQNLASQAYEREIEEFRNAEDAKTRALEAAAAERNLLLDEEYQQRKAKIEEDFARIMGQDEESRALRQKEIEDGTIQRDVERASINALDEDARLLREARERELADALAALQDEMNGKRRESDEQLQTDLDAQAAARDAREKQMAAAREAREKQLAKTTAFLQWAADSAAVRAKARMEYQSTLISGVTNAAQTFGAVVASMATLGPVGVALGIGMGTAMAATILSQSVVAANAALSQSVLPPMQLFFAKGGVLSGTETMPTDSIGPAYLSRGEAVIDADRTSKLFNWIDRRESGDVTHFNGDLNFYIAPNSSDRQAEEINERLGEMLRARRRSGRAA